MSKAMVVVVMLVPMRVSVVMVVGVVMLVSVGAEVIMRMLAPVSGTGKANLMNNNGLLGFEHRL